jgi:hypothetical protein
MEIEVSEMAMAVLILFLGAFFLANCRFSSRRSPPSPLKVPFMGNVLQAAWHHRSPLTWYRHHDILQRRADSPVTKRCRYSSLADHFYAKTGKCTFQMQCLRSSVTHVSDPSCARFLFSSHNTK